MRGSDQLPEVPVEDLDPRIPLTFEIEGDVWCWCYSGATRTIVEGTAVAEWRVANGGARALAQLAHQIPDDILDDGLVPWPRCPQSSKPFAPLGGP